MICLSISKDAHPLNTKLTFVVYVVLVQSSECISFPVTFSIFSCQLNKNQETSDYVGGAEVSEFIKFIYIKYQISTFSVTGFSISFHNPAPAKPLHPERTFFGLQKQKQRLGCEVLYNAQMILIMWRRDGRKEAVENQMDLLTIAGCYTWTDTDRQALWSVTKTLDVLLNHFSASAWFLIDLIFFFSVD